MRIPRFTLTALLGASAFATTVHAGVYVENVEKQLDGSTAPETSKMWVDGGRMRVENTSKENAGFVIFRDKAMYLFDPKTQSYRVIDKAAADKIGAQVANAKKQLEARMAAMPPEQRKQVEEMMAKSGAAGALLQGKKPAQRTVQNTGRTETVAGIKCTVWEVLEDGNKREELCAAQPSAVPGGDEVVKTFREIGSTMQSFTENLGSIANNQPWSDMDTIKGVPILTREFSNGKATSELRVASVRKESVQAAQFDVPAGYKEKKLEFGPGGQ